MDDNNKPSLGQEDGIWPEDAFAGAPAPELDPAEYLADMEGFAMSEAQKIELLETLWSIMRAFVEMGVDVGAADPCGKMFEGLALDSVEGVTSPFASAASAHSVHNHKKEEDATI